LGKFNRRASSAASSVPPSTTDVGTSEAGDFTQGGISDAEDAGEPEEETEDDEAIGNVKINVAKAKAGSAAKTVRIHSAQFTN
jgi:hypothetical protein